MTSLHLPWLIVFIAFAMSVSLTLSHHKNGSKRNPYVSNTKRCLKKNQSLSTSLPNGTSRSDENEPFEIKAVWGNPLNHETEPKNDRSFTLWRSTHWAHSYARGNMKKSIKKMTIKLMIIDSSPLLSPVSLHWLALWLPSLNQAIGYGVITLLLVGHEGLAFCQMRYL